MILCLQPSLYFWYKYYLEKSINSKIVQTERAILVFEKVNIEIGLYSVESLKVGLFVITVGKCQVIPRNTMNITYTLIN